MVDADKGEHLRAFLAIPLETRLIDNIRRLQRQLGAELDGVHWSRAENLHLTLRFFANIEAESLEKAAKLMLSVDSLGSRFTLPLTHLGAFPSTTRPRVLWAGLETCSDLHGLYRRTGEILEQAGIAYERRPFLPHLTLGRARGRLPDITALLKRYENRLKDQLTVNHLVLYRSRLLPQGAEHTPLYSFTLDGPQP